MQFIFWTLVIMAGMTGAEVLSLSIRFGLVAWGQARARKAYLSHISAQQQEALKAAPVNQPILNGSASANLN